MRIPAVFMRGGTSKGVFFRAEDLPQDPAARDALLLRVVGSPDPYGTQIDGMGAGTSSTSKVVVISRSTQPGHDVDYLFGAVDIGSALIDWSGNCGNLSAAVGPFAIAQGLVAAPRNGKALVRIWQVNTSKTIRAYVPMADGAVLESGDFTLDGVAFPSAGIQLEFLQPGGGEGEEAGPLFPTGKVLDTLQVPGFGTIEATLINAGNPAVFIRAEILGLKGTELRNEINQDPALLARVETLRAHAALAMGLADSVASATLHRPATPKLAYFAAPQSYMAADGRPVSASNIDLLARIFSMGKLHHAMTGTGAIAIAAAAAIPGTVVSSIMNSKTGGGEEERAVAFGHPSGVTRVAAMARRAPSGWEIERVTLQRSARVLMEGFVRLPA